MVTTHNLTAAVAAASMARLDFESVLAAIVGALIAGLGHGVLHEMLRRQKERLLRESILVRCGEIGKTLLRVHSRDQFRALEGDVSIIMHEAGFALGASFSKSDRALYSDMCRLRYLLFATNDCDEEAVAAKIVEAKEVAARIDQRNLPKN